MDLVWWIVLVAAIVVVVIGLFAVIRARQRSGSVLASPRRRGPGDGAGSWNGGSP